MSIKKNGGIFGRNPTFNNVEVENDLRVGGDLIINGETVTGLDFEGSWNASTNTPDVTASPTVGQFWIVSVAGSTNLSGITTWDVGDWALYDGSAWQRVEGGGNGTFTKVNVDNLQLDGNRISSTNTDGNVEIVPNGSGYIDIINRYTYIRNDGYAGSGTQRGIRWYGIGNNPYLLGEIVSDTNGLDYGRGDIVFRLKTTTAAGVNASTSERFRVGFNGHIKPAGNLILNSGQGIDFSATAGTGTSELLNDYEEGTWTPQYTNTTPPTTPYTMDIVSANYVKIGSTVIVTANIRTDSVDTTGALGALRISGLPFTCGSSLGSVSVFGAIDWGGDFPSSGYVNPSSTQIILLSRSSVNGATFENNAADLTSGVTANQNVLWFSAVYSV